jgi:hypothetical protein
MIKIIRKGGLVEVEDVGKNISMYALNEAQIDFAFNGSRYISISFAASAKVYSIDLSNSLPDTLIINDVDVSALSIEDIKEALGSVFSVSVTGSTGGGGGGGGDASAILQQSQINVANTGNQRLEDISNSSTEIKLNTQQIKAAIDESNIKLGAVQADTNDAKVLLGNINTKLTSVDTSTQTSANASGGIINKLTDVNLKLDFSNNALSDVINETGATAQNTSAGNNLLLAIRDKIIAAPSTSALQTTGNASLASIDSKATARNTSLASIDSKATARNTSLTNIESRLTNGEFIALTSTPRSATINTADIINNNFNKLRIVVDVTQVTAGGEIALIVQYKDAGSGKYYNVLTSGIITATGLFFYRIGDCLPTQAGTVLQDYLARTFRIQILHNNANPLTYTVTYTLSK